MSVIIRPGTVQDAHSIAPRLREADRKEILLGWGEDVLGALVASVEASHECFAGELNGVPIALGGIVGRDGGGFPWLVGSPECVRFPVKLTSAGIVAVARWEREFQVMCNYSHIDNTVHHAWLRNLGFSFMPDAVPYGPRQAPFFLFYRCANVR